MALTFKGDYALAEKRLQEAEKILDGLYKTSLKNPYAVPVPADSLLARKDEIRKWFEENSRKENQ